MSSKRTKKITLLFLFSLQISIVMTAIIRDFVVTIESDCLFNDRSKFYHKITESTLSTTNSFASVAVTAGKKSKKI